MKNKMKRLKYKHTYKDVKDAINKIPEVLKENNQVFELTDGNKTYKVRWEGSLTEGKAVVLQGEDKSLIKEEKSRMKDLMGYKPEAVIGTPTTKDRIKEDTKFRELMGTSKKKSLTESTLTLEDLDALNEELIEEGVLDTVKQLALAIGISLSTFNAIAQDNPQKAVETVKTEYSKLSPEQKQEVRNVLGTNYNDSTMDSLFMYKNRPEHVSAPELNLGQYKDINVLSVDPPKANERGGFDYTVDIKYKTYVENGGIFRYLGQQNKNLKNSSIKFTYKGSPMPTKTITYK